MYFPYLLVARTYLNVDKTAYHIVLVCGQSNTHYGKGLDPLIDTPHTQILQLGRSEGQDPSILLAEQPLDHHSKVGGSIGFAMTFGKLYVSEYMPDNERMLIIPCGASGTGFKKGNWNKGDYLYEDAVYRYHYVKNKFPQSHLTAILWHQGESDLKNDYYQTDFRTRYVIVLSDNSIWWFAPGDDWKKSSTAGLPSKFDIKALKAYSKTDGTRYTVLLSDNSIWWFVPGNDWKKSSMSGLSN